jgi:hypothetical protein
MFLISYIVKLKNYFFLQTFAKLIFFLNVRLLFNVFLRVNQGLTPSGEAMMVSVPPFFSRAF